MVSGPQTVAAAPRPRGGVGISTARLAGNAPSWIRLELMGGFALHLDGRPIRLPLSVQRVIAFVALATRPVQRIYVAGCLWIDSSEDHANASLRTALWRLGRLGAAVREALRVLAQEDLEVAARVALERGQHVAELHRRRRLGHRDRAAVIELLGGRCARLEVDEEVALEEDPRPDLGRRVGVQLAEFVVADLTDPRSVPQELQAIVPDVMVPIRPLILASEEPWSMFKDLTRKYRWLMEPYRYSDLEHLLSTIDEGVIEPAEEKRRELLA